MAGRLILRRGHLKIRFLGTHNAESKDFKLVTFVIDGILAVDAGSLTSGLTFAEQKRIKAILLSHGHYDHIRDLPAFAFSSSPRVVKVFSTQVTLQIFVSHLADGIIYPEFASENSFLSQSILDLCPVEPFHSFEAEGFQILPVPVQHPISAVGFEISRDGKHIFYTGDTGPGLAAIWQHISPQLLIIDMTFPNSLKDTARESGHLCPEILKNELVEFQRIKGYLPRVSLIHLSPQYESEIAEDVKALAEKLPVSIAIAAEGAEIIL